MQEHVNLMRKDGSSEYKVLAVARREVTKNTPLFLLVDIVTPKITYLFVRLISKFINLIVHTQFEPRHLVHIYIVLS